MPAPGWRPEGTGRFALVLAMIGITTLFLVFVAAWLLLRRNEPDAMRASPLVPPRALWTSTAILGLSSVLVELSVRARSQHAGGWLVGGIASGLAFIAAQSFLWRELVREGLVPSSGAYGAIFFALTILHAAHVLVGLFALVVARGRLRRGVLRPGGLRLCATYWHFMGVLWLALFGVLMCT
jgi:cytochrome c oxidase subunit 3